MLFYVKWKGIEVVNQRSKIEYYFSKKLGYGHSGAMGITKGQIKKLYYSKKPANIAIKLFAEFN